MSVAHEQSNEYEIFSKPRYDLGEREIHQLTQQLLQERRPTTDDRIICYGIDQASPYANIARSVECEVFENYFGNNAEQMEEEYGPYERQSRFFLSVDQEASQPAGVLRVIENGSSGLKTLNDLEGMDAHDPALPSITADKLQAAHAIESFDECWDIGTVAVRRPYKSATTTTSVQLYRALYVSALDEDIKHFVSIVDSRPLARMVDYLGIPFVPMAGSQPFSYLGSESSQAVYGNVTEFYGKMNRKRWSIKGVMARKALGPLVKGTEDKALQL